MFSKILKSKRMIQSLEIKYVTKNKPNTSSQKMSQSLEIKYLPQNMNKSLDIKISKLNDCQKD